MNSRLRIGVAADYLEEGWHSMDLMAEMVVDHINRDHGNDYFAELLRPAFRRRFSSSRTTGKWPFSLDRASNRFFDYGRYLRSRRKDFDIFHITDHSYSQLIFSLPQDRTIITCHDLDAFRSLMPSESEPRSFVFRAFTKRILKGFQRAAAVCCDTSFLRDKIAEAHLFPAERMFVVPNGVHPAFRETPDMESEEMVSRILGPPNRDAIDLLHVGSTIPRKRIDVLLKVFASIKQIFPSARLVRVGGDFTAEQLRLAATLGIESSTIVMPYLSRNQLAATYRRSALLLLPSEREGFGFPVIEAMAAGTPVVATDLPTIREAGGAVAEYCRAADVNSWSETITRLLRLRQDSSKWNALRRQCNSHAGTFSWSAAVTKLLDVYQSVAAQRKAMLAPQKVIS